MYNMKYDTKYLFFCRAFLIKIKLYIPFKFARKSYSFEKDDLPDLHFQGYLTSQFSPNKFDFHIDIKLKLILSH